MTGRDASRPATATALARRRGDRIVAVVANAADLPPVTQAQPATLRYLGQVAGLAHRREFRCDTLAALVRAGLVGCRGLPGSRSPRWGCDCWSASPPERPYPPAR